MSKYYKAEDVTELINACEWRMTLAKERHGEGFVDYSKQILDVDELTKRLSNLPTIEVSEDCISRADLIESFLADSECKREEAKACMCSIDFMLELIEDAPSVALSRAGGEWKYGDLGQAYDFPTCSKCGYEVEEETNYCPNCGAKMKGTEE